MYNNFYLGRFTFYIVSLLFLLSIPFYTVNQVLLGGRLRSLPRKCLLGFGRFRNVSGKQGARRLQVIANALCLD